MRFDDILTEQERLEERSTFEGPAPKKPPILEMLGESYPSPEAEIASESSLSDEISYAEKEAQGAASKTKEIESAWKASKGKKLGTEATLEDTYALYRKQHHVVYPPGKVSIYCAALGCSPKGITSMTESYSTFQSGLIRYALFQSFNDPKSTYSMEQIKVSIGGQEHEINAGLNELDRISISLKKTVDIPAYYHVLVTHKSSKEKVIIQTISDYSSFRVLAFATSKQAVNNFFEWINAQVKIHNFLKGANIDGECKFIDVESLNRSDIVLRDGIWETLQSNVVDMFEKEHIYLANGIQAKRGFALVGPPGTGKTTLFKILASELKKVTCILVTPSQLGYGPQSISRIYQLANDLAPSLVFLEDADIWAKKREYGETSGGMLTELMNRLDGVVPLKGVITGLSSNRPEVLEGALINRPGRFDIRIYLGPPDAKGRFEILRKRFEKINIDPKIVKDFIENESLEKFTPAMLSEVSKRAVIYAIEDGNYNKKDYKATVLEKHLEKALSSMLSEMDQQGNYVNDASMYESVYGHEFPSIDSIGDKPQNLQQWIHDTAYSICESAENDQGLPVSQQFDRFMKGLEGISNRERHLVERVTSEDVKDMIRLHAGDVKIKWERPMSKYPRFRSSVDNLLNQESRLLRRLKVKPDAIETAKKLLDDDDATFEDIVNTLTGGG